MTINERRELRMRKLREKMQREDDKRRAIEASGNTFMLRLMGIKEEELTPHEVFTRQMQLIFDNWAKGMMSKTGVCPCCKRPADVTVPEASAQ